MNFKKTKRTSTVFLLSLLVWILESDAANFQWETCQGGNQAYVTDYIASELGSTELTQRVKDLVITADRMADRAFTKTWATHLSDSEYMNINFGTGPVIRANEKRFGYPEGAVSGGYGSAPIAQNIESHFKNWEHRSRESADWAYRYMLKISGIIERFIDWLPIPGSKNECGKPRIFHSTHAEIKLFTKLKQNGELPTDSQLLISVSRHMCKNCRAIFAHLARNGRHKIVVGSPRKGRSPGTCSPTSRGTTGSLQQPEYIIFRPDGSFRSFVRTTTEDSYVCNNTQMVAPLPEGIDSPPIQPDPATVEILFREKTGEGNMSRTVQKYSERSNNIADLKPSSRNVCGSGTDGPANLCFTFLKTSLPKAVGCPRPGTVTGIHGAFGIDSPKHRIIVLKNIGIFCDVRVRQPAMGPHGQIKFELKCPSGYQMTGIHGRFGALVDKVGIICRRVSDGKYWESKLEGLSNGGRYRSKECDRGYAGRTVRMWFNTAIDGLGMCCR